MLTDRAQELLSRLRSASDRAFPAAINDVVEYLDANVSAANPCLTALQNDRVTKWAEWGSEDGWEFPQSKEDRTSLAWDLYRTCAERNDQGDGLTFHMYRQQHFASNVARFQADWFDYLLDAVLGVVGQEDGRDPSGREKQQKFGILDAPGLLPDDLRAMPGVLGRAAIFVDIDNFKPLNTTFSEVIVDRSILPPVHQLVRDCASGIGYAYAFGGDEFIVLLPNATSDMALAFAEAVRAKVGDLSLQVQAATVRLAASCGVAHEALIDSSMSLDERANRAMRRAKALGGNRVCVWELAPEA